MHFTSLYTLVALASGAVALAERDQVADPSGGGYVPPPFYQPPQPTRRQAYDPPPFEEPDLGPLKPTVINRRQEFDGGPEYPVPTTTLGLKVRQDDPFKHPGPVPSFTTRNLRRDPKATPPTKVIRDEEPSKAEPLARRQTETLFMPTVAPPKDPGTASSCTHENFKDLDNSEGICNAVGAKYGLFIGCCLSDAMLEPYAQGCADNGGILRPGVKGTCDLAA